MKLVILSICLSFLFACAQVPVNSCDAGSIYGYLRSEAHKDYLSKHLHDPELKKYRSEDGGKSYLETMVDYDHLQELYACLTVKEKAPVRYEMTINEHGIKPHALALAPGDTLYINNLSEQNLSLYLAPIDQNDERFQGFPLLVSGKSAEYEVNLEGYLQLSSDENETLDSFLWSVKNHQCKRLQSNDFYNFTELPPGAYEISFWYWRIGTLQHKLLIGKGQDIRMDEILSIDRVLDVNRQDYYSGGVY